MLGITGTLALRVCEDTQRNGPVFISRAALQQASSQGRGRVTFAETGAIQSAAFTSGSHCCDDCAMSTEPTERRCEPRTNLSQAVYIRPFDSRLPPDACATFNISQNGLYFATSADHYTPGMNVYMTSDFQPGSVIHFATAGVIVRVEKLEGDKWGMAIQILSPSSSTSEPRETAN
jgi:hypothetical protein